MEAVDWDAASVKVVVLEAANVEYLGCHLCILTKEAILVATLHKQNGIRILGLNGNVLLL